MLTAGESGAGNATPPPAPEIITRAEFARRMKVSKPAITNAVNAGRLHGQALCGKKLRYRLAVEQWTKNRDPQADLHREDLDEDEDAAESESGRGTGSAGGGYRSEKAQTEKVRRELLEIQRNRELDRYRDKEEVLRAMQTAGRQVAQHLEMIEGWAEQLARISDPMELRKALRANVRALREKIAAVLSDIDETEEPEPEHETPIDS